MKEVKVALIGFGGIGHVHNTAYASLAKEGAPVKLVAICDIDESKFHGNVEINDAKAVEAIPEGVQFFTNVDEMLRGVDFDMADICLPTYMHKDMTCKMLYAGKHVLCEKPMALDSGECAEMIEVSKETGKKLMIAQVLRFSPNYRFLKDCIDSGKLGKLKNLSLDRFSVYPTWGFENWFSSTEKSGGCILDMHIHDIDFARFCLGEPDAVSVITYDGISRWQYVDSRLFYGNVPVVVRATWDEAKTAPFKEAYRARFEKASVVLESGKVTVYPDDGEKYEAPVAAANAYAEEIRFFASTILDESIKNVNNAPEGTLNTVKLIETLRKSAQLGGERVMFN